MLFCGEFRPGSTLFFVWNENRQDQLNAATFQLGRDVRDTFAVPAHDVVMLKVSYWFNK